MQRAKKVKVVFKNSAEGQMLPVVRTYYKTPEYS